jgi:hypothetical protein
MIKETILAVCSWANPGADPYMGDVISAIDRYKDIPFEIRQKLKEKAYARTYDDFAIITSDKIEGKYQYENLREMHFGNIKICVLPSRALWPAQHQERGLVYCEEDHCIIIPTVCRNVSRITKIKEKQELPKIEIEGGTGGFNFKLWELDLRTSEEYELKLTYELEFQKWSFKKYKESFSFNDLSTPYYKINSIKDTKRVIEIPEISTNYLFLIGLLFTLAVYYNKTLIQFFKNS